MFYKMHMEEKGRDIISTLDSKIPGNGIIVLKIKYEPEKVLGPDCISIAKG